MAGDDTVPGHPPPTRREYPLYPGCGETPGAADPGLDRRPVPDRAAGLRRDRTVGEPDARQLRRARRTAAGTPTRPPAGRADGLRERLAGRLPRKGRPAELLGLVVRTVRDRGAAPAARPASAARPPRHRAR